MSSTIDRVELKRTLQHARQGGHLRTQDTAAIFYSLSLLQQRLGLMRSAFPTSTLHAVAVKANPLPSVLKKIAVWGYGAEVASMPELRIALESGFPVERIVFDSPAKTNEEIQASLALGVHINIDNFQELARFEAALASTQDPSADRHIGIRINPEVGAGTIASTSVASTDSKFGVPFEAHQDELYEAYLRCPWLNGVHLHVGSQGCAPELLLRGVEKVFAFVEEVNRRAGRQQITSVDVGGGLPVAYAPSQEVMSMQTYVSMLTERCPRLFDGSYRLLTEFGRYVHANTAWAYSQVEYVKPGKEADTIIIHLGADMFLRESYHRDDWHHEMEVIPETELLEDTKEDVDSSASVGLYHVAGPLCFSGDYIAKSRTLRRPEPGDAFIICDAGAYTLSMWSRYNSRCMPVVLGYTPDEDGVTFEVLRRRETWEDVVSFWALGSD